MKKTSLWTSYLEGIRYETPGESYSAIIRYIIPECVTALVLYSLASLVDARFIAHLTSTTAYATMSAINPLMHCITKVAEGLSVGVMILCGLFHGKGDAQGVGRALSVALLITSCVGAICALILFCFAPWVYYLLGTPLELIEMGVPFLRVRAVGIFFMFLFFALSGFLRGIKQNFFAMRCYLVGVIVFLLFDYLLIFGKCGFPELCLQGSAVASVLQYITMVLAALYVIFSRREMHTHFSLQSPFSWHTIRSLCELSWPVIGDKAMLSIARVVIVMNVAPMGSKVLSSFNAIRDIESLVFVPAIACAQVVTFLVSNNLGAGDYQGVKYTIKKTLLLAVASAGVLLLFFTWQAPYFISLFDKQHAFTDFAVSIYRCISLVALFDVIQVILAGALRGAAQVRVVLWVRAMTILCFCMPVMYATSFVTFQSDFVKLMTIYSPFYIGSGLMALWYVYWLRSGRWQQVKW